jgi:hypothetical protein
MQVIKQTPRALGEEAITGGLQQITDIAGQFSLRERQGDIFTGDNFVEVIDAAIKEAVGGLSAQGVNVLAASGKQKLKNDTEAQIKRRLEDSAALDAENTTELLDLLDTYEAEERAKDPTATPTIITQRAGKRVAEHREDNKAREEAFDPLKVEPKVKTPKVKTPKAETPKAETPKAETPKVEPEVGTPEVGTPEVGTPEVELDVGTPRINYGKQEQKVKELLTETYTEENLNADIASGAIPVGKDNNLVGKSIKEIKKRVGEAAPKAGKPIVGSEFAEDSTRS